MRALVKSATGTTGTALCDVPLPEPGPGEALVRVRAAAVCASDLHIYRDKFPCELPVVLGHEFTGVVERAGPDVAGPSPGTPVVAANNPEACGTCRVCSEGYPNMCARKRALGFKRDGCFADFVLVPADLLYPVPENVSVAAAALAEPLAVAVHAVEDRCGIREGDTVVVFGPGAVGLLEAQVARAEGAVRVIVAGAAADAAARLPLADGLGLEVCNAQEEDLRQRVLDVTDGAGADVVVEASGAPAAIAAGIGLLRRGGRLAVSGITGRPEVPLPWDELVSKAATVFFAYSSRARNWEKGLQYLARGTIRADPLVTHRFPLEHWREAFELMEKAACIRALLVLPEDT